MEAGDLESFMNRLKWKEALYLMDQGQDADPETTKKILDQILPKESNRETILFRFRDRLMEVLGPSFATFQIPPTQIAFRGTSTEVYRLERPLLQDTIALLFTANPSLSEVQLSLEMQKPKPYRVKLKLDGDTIETLADLSRETSFETPILQEASPELVFFEKNREIARLQLLFETF
ncbi:hypothetical protein LPTSP4_02240 [Leptospira ryugenii]|uniref:Uncharacterized protein n=1 Tax=Leptospira ryugenii TaxID=1917863 RepID=A0A2P2DVS6_9LEPT|nr:hypothetical protein [Leptospira ryugenii]GBF48724.1 hypothetical protein LPTSP4_02240 [Leptospira ryugenii]